MKHSEPERITPKLLAELRRITPYAPDHLPREIGLIEAFRTRHPTLPQVACFDTAFHRTMRACRGFFKMIGLIALAIALLVIIRHLAGGGFGHQMPG